MAPPNMRVTLSAPLLSESAGIKLTVGQAIAYFVQWLVVGIVISLIYAPAHTS